MDQGLIHKYLLGEATEEETEQLFTWIEASEENKRAYILYKQKWSINTEVNMDLSNSWIKIRKNTIDKERRKRITNRYKYAAVIAIIISTAFYLSKDIFKPIQTDFIRGESIILTLSNGSTEVLSEIDEQVIKNTQGQTIGIKKGTQLTYTSATPTAREMAYNTIKVPYGKRFTLTLTDGTHISLNAGSTLRYPEGFSEGKERRVYLQGEGFFNVEEDKAHPFIVETKDNSIRVLGTKFNVSSYPDDEENNTVLVEGSIALGTKGQDHLEQITLQPGFMASWPSNSPSSVLLEEVDTDVYTGWLEGKIVFKNTPFKEIRKRLERHYNVAIQNTDTILDRKKFTGTFDIETLEEVLAILNENYPLRYLKQNDTIIIH